MEDDADLVRRALARDQQAFAALYDRYADKLYDYARRQTGNAADASDIVQDTFVLAIQRLHQLRDPSLVRPWLYAIARSEVHRRHRRVNKLQFTEPDEQAAMNSGGPTADDLVHQQELRVLFAEAANGLDPSDREVLDLHLRHSMTGAEIAATLGIPERQVAVVVGRVRERLGRSIGVVLLAKTPKCGELVELQRTEGAPLTVLSRKRLARHIEGCLTCSQQLSDRMRPETLLAALPIALAPAFLRNGALQRMAEVANSATPGSGSTHHHTSSARTLAPREGGRVWQTSDGFPRLVSRSRRVALVIGAGVAAVLLVLFGVLVVTGGDSAKRITAGTTTIDGRVAASSSTTTTSSTTSTTTAPDVGTTAPASTAPVALPSTPDVTVPPTVQPTPPPTTRPRATNPPATSPPATNPPTTTNPPATTPPTTAPDTTAPVLQSASASPTNISAKWNSGSACPAYPTTTTITANVTDDRGVASVSVQYTIGANAYNASLSNVGGVWKVTIGPFPSELFADNGSEATYPVDASFTATDTTGNARVSNVSNLAVLHDCYIVT